MPPRKRHRSLPAGRGGSKGLWQYAPLDAMFPIMKTRFVLASVSLFFAIDSLTPAFAADPSEAPVFQLRLVADTPTPNSEDMAVIDQRKNAGQQERLSVEKTVLIDQTGVKSATVRKDPLGQPQIEVSFTEGGKKRLAEVTRDSLGKRLAIVINGKLYSAPKILSEISGGMAMISGNFTESEAKDLAGKINAALSK